MPPTLRLKKQEHRRIVKGHLWVFSNEVGEVDAEADTGSIVRVEDAAHNFLGMGFYNRNSLISVRMLSRKEEGIDGAFFTARLRSAAALREAIFPGSTAYRLAHGESDLLPGLVIDRYNDSYVIQISSAGMQLMASTIVEVLHDLLGAKTVIARNDSALRRLEGLDSENAVLLGAPSLEIITDGILDFEIDLVEGQKTGFFYDQRENRKTIRPFCDGARVLDCYTNSGGFALHAASAGAKEVIGVDSSEGALAAAARNAARNGVAESCHWIKEDVFDALKRLVAAREKFDVVVVDPPAFAKNRKSLPAAIKAYVELQTLGMLLLKEGAVFATASCSHHLSAEEFDEIISAAASKTKTHLQLIEKRGAAGDHPVLAGMAETEYLKFRLGRAM